MAFDYDSPFAGNQLQESIESQMRILGGRWDGMIGAECYNMKPKTKAKRPSSTHYGSLEMSKQTDAKGKVNQAKLDMMKVYRDICKYDVEVCFSGDELKEGEADVVQPVIERMREAADKEKVKAALHALFGPIIHGNDVCKLAASRDICHIGHNNEGLTPEKVKEIERIVGEWYGDSEIIVGVTHQSTIDMKNYDEWTNNDFLTSKTPSAYDGMIQKWGNVKFKKMADFRKVEDIVSDPWGQMEPIIPAVPYIDPATTTWDGMSFVRFLPVWVKTGLDYTPSYGPMINVNMDAWKDRSLTYGVGLIRADMAFGFDFNDSRARAMVCVVEKSKALSEAYIKQGGTGFGAPYAELLPILETGGTP